MQKELCVSCSVPANITHKRNFPLNTPPLVTTSPQCGVIVAIRPIRKMRREIVEIRYEMTQMQIERHWMAALKSESRRILGL